MEKMTNIEVGQFIALFNRCGYVLNFSTNEFDTFTMESVGIPLCEKYQLSKGKSLISFVQDEHHGENEKIKLLVDLFDYYEEYYKNEYDIFSQDDYSVYGFQYDKKYDDLHEKCKKIVNRIKNIEDINYKKAEELKGMFTSDFLSKQIDLMLKLQEESPSDAIGKAKELIESCCKTILRKRGKEINEKWDIGKLAEETFTVLSIKPELVITKDEEKEKILKAIYGNLRGMVTKIAELRNKYGSGHGKDEDFESIPAKYAKLAVGCSISITTFLWDTYNETI